MTATTTSNKQQKQTTTTTTATTKVHLFELDPFDSLKGTMPEITKVLKKAPRHPTSKGAKVYLVIRSFTHDRKVHFI